MKTLLPRPHRKAKLDVSLAIVNLVLLLIFFFLSTGRLLNPVTNEIDLSETTDLPLDQLPSPILVVGEDGVWSLDGAPVAPELLGAALQSLPQPVTLHVLINRAAPANSLLAVINRPELRDVSLRLVTMHRRAQK